MTAHEAATRLERIGILLRKHNVVPKNGIWENDCRNGRQLILRYGSRGWTNFGDPLHYRQMIPALRVVEEWLDRCVVDLKQRVVAYCGTIERRQAMLEEFRTKGIG
jgi:hypothetical protein